jgi:4-methoxybenzoate monooxygenase (O-demethylating)
MARSAYALYEDAPPVGAAPVDLDPFSRDFLSDPYPGFTQMLDAGPVVWLSAYSMLGVARYEQVRKVLSDWETFSSARGVGMADFVRHGRFRLPSIILEVDPPHHTRARAALGKALSQPVMRRLRESFTAAAEEMVERLVTRGAFDGVADLARAYPLLVFPPALGMRPDHVDLLLPYGDLVFNSFGPANDLFQAAAPLAKQAFPIIEDEALRKNLSPDGFGCILYQCADSGDVTEEEAHKLVRSLLTAGVDTTVNAIGAALHALARFPDQYAKLHAHPELARAAFEEALRFESPVQTFFRTAAKPAELDGVQIEEGAKMLMFLGAANRDPRKWDNPDAFDIERNASGHVALGAGIHLCVGRLLARLEGEVVLAALAKRVKRLWIDGEPKRQLNNTLRGLASLPLRVERA